MSNECWLIFEQLGLLMCVNLRSIELCWISSAGYFNSLDFLTKVWSFCVALCCILVLIFTCVCGLFAWLPLSLSLSSNQRLSSCLRAFGWGFAICWYDIFCYSLWVMNVGWCLNNLGSIELCWRLSVDMFSSWVSCCVLVLSFMCICELFTGIVVVFREVWFL